MDTLVLKAFNINSIGRNSINKITKNNNEIDYISFCTLTATSLFSDYENLEQEYTLKRLDKAHNGLGRIQVSLGAIDFIYRGNTISAIIINLDKLSKEEFINSFLTDERNQDILRNKLEMLYNKVILMKENKDWELLDDLTDKYNIILSQETLHLTEAYVYARITDNGQHRLCLDLDSENFSYIRPTLKVYSIEIECGESSIVIDKTNNNYIDVFAQAISILGNQKIESTQHNTKTFNIGTDNLKIDGFYNNNIASIAFNIEESHRITLVISNGNKYNLGDTINKILIMDGEDNIPYHFNNFQFKNVHLNDKIAYKDNLYRLEIDI